MSQIKSITIQNFKGIQNLHLDFTYENQENEILDNIILYGINGSGKSSILEALYLPLYCANIYHVNSIVNRFDDTEINDYIINLFALDNEWIYKNENSFSITIDIIDENKIKSLTLSYMTSNELHWNITENISNDLGNGLVFLSSYRLLKPSTIQKAGDWGEFEQLKQKKIKDWFNRGFQNKYKYTDEHFFPSLSLQFENDYKVIKQLLVNLITDKKVGVLSKENTQILDKIHEAFSIFFPNKKFLEQLSRDSMFQDYRLMIENEDGSIVDLDQLSSGEREIIAFFTTLCSREYDLKILIIDEPELHLHSKWQSILLPAIHKLFPNVQLFMATHSKEIHQSASSSELFELIKE